jgi:hypothetical protein
MYFPVFKLLLSVLFTNTKEFFSKELNFNFENTFNNSSSAYWIFNIMFIIFQAYSDKCIAEAKAKKAARARPAKPKKEVQLEFLH